MPNYDLCVIGAGPGGYVAAIRAAQLALKVCVVERDELGGTCLNRGCIPTKALWQSAKLLTLVENAQEFGIGLPKARISFKKAQDRSAKAIAALRKGVQALLKKNKVDIIRGVAALKGARAVDVTQDGKSISINSSKIILATGSEPVRPAAFPFDGKRIVTSDELLAMQALPRTILIVGAGYIGCEFASILRPFGVEITLLEALDRVLPELDADISAEMTRAFKRRKIAIHTGSKIDSMDTTNKAVTAKLANGKSITAEMALVCVGRKSVIEGIGLEAADVQMNDGVISRNESCQTSVPSIYAIGDMASRFQLAHWASAEGKVAAEHAAGEPVKVNETVIPSCVFTIPEVATVGLTEAQAKEKGLNIQVAKFPYRNLGKALIAGELDGFFKLVADAATGELLGAQIVGADASNMIAELALGIRLETTIDEVAATVHAHPTLPEGIMEAAEMWLGRAIHA